MSDRRERAAATLAARGIPAERVATGVLSADELRGLAAEREAPEVLAALAELGEQSTATLLAALERETSDRALAKATRRALHRLRERGIEVPPPAPRATAALGSPTAECEAWISAPDGTGTRLVWLVRSLAAGTALLVTAELAESGLADLRVSEVSRKQLRGARARLRDAGIAMVSLPFETADALVVDAERRRGDVEHGRGYLRVRPRLTAAEPLAAAEPTSPRVRTPADEDVELLAAGSVSLLAEPELRGWWPRPEAAEPFLARLGEAEDSPIVLSREQQETRLAAVLDEARGALFPAGPTARRLRALAYVLAESGRPEPARTALAVAQVLEGLGGERREVPLVTALVHQGLGRLAAARSAEREAERRSALVVTPGEALKARSPGHPPRTRS